MKLPPACVLLTAVVPGMARHAAADVLLVGPLGPYHEVQDAVEAANDPALLQTAPHSAPVRRLDEVKAARQLVLCHHPGRPIESAEDGDAR